MKKTTLGYIEYNNCYLMLLRDVDKSDGSLGKWLGVGGKLEKDESEDDCFIREVYEETGITLTSSSINKCGIVDFRSDKYEDERMYLYTASVDSDWYAPDCNEGKLKWIKKEEVLSLNMWEGDHVFLEKLMASSSNSFFKLSLIYGGKNGDELIEILDDTLLF